MRKQAYKFLSAFVLLICTLFVEASNTERFYLSGTDKDNTKTWDFYIDKGRKSGVWDKIEVPSHWEFQGFGTYHYGWPDRATGENAIYRTRFHAPSHWKGKSVEIVFEGVMTDAVVKINGKTVGEKHQGAFYRFLHDISELIRYNADNTLEVLVNKVSSDASVNRAELDGDYWVFGGIYRPVYMDVKPKSHIQRVAIDAAATGAFNMDVFLAQAKKGDELSVQVFTLDGRSVGKPFSQMIIENNQAKIRLQTQIDKPALWNAETPSLYKVEIALKQKGKVVHHAEERFGFRTLELRQYDGLYVNGQKVILKGVNRHSHWPESGRCLSREIHLADIALIKEMNMNAVRMSHYPPDSEFLHLCDSLGLYVINELAGWQKAYDTEPGRKLVRSMVQRDVNHPSIILWANGNEGGWNRELDGDFAQYDIQQREVFHAWEKFSFWDSKHYPNFNYVTSSVLHTKEIILPTEFLHGLYDGGSGAGLDDFWNAYLRAPNFGGGFLWVLSDEGIVRNDMDNWVDANKNYYPDGIVGPYREKEASVFAIREIWSPVQIEARRITPSFDGRLKIENRFDFTNLKECSFSWRLEQLPLMGKPEGQKVALSGIIDSPDLAPWEKGTLFVDLPKVRTQFDVLYLTANNPKGDEIFTWSFSLKMASKQALPKISSSQGAIEVNETALEIIVQANGNSYVFNKESGLLKQVTGRKGSIYSFGNGPVLAGEEQQLERIHHWRNEDGFFVKTDFKGEKNWLTVTWKFVAGQAAQLDYAYSQQGMHDFMGISFNFPEEKIKSMRWLGNGPYRVWKNRLKGNQFGVWQKSYNNAVTGEVWDYPEFKGYHSELYWVEIETGDGIISVQNHEPGVFLQMLKPQPPKHAGNNHNAPPFPNGDIGFMNAISPIGTKFHPANELGPQGQKNMQLNYLPIKGRLYFDFE